MSKMSEQARSQAKEKVSRLMRTDPHQKVDASSWTPSEPMDADVQTGMRPLSRRAFRHGGKVHGEAHVNMGRKPRKSGGGVDAWMNRNEKSANSERDGTKHRGALKRGGKVHADAAEDKKLIHEMGCKCAKCSGGRVERKAGGRTKKGTNINIIIAPQGQKPPMSMPPPGMPPGGPVGLHQAPPPPAGAPPPMGGPPPGMPPMARKDGGRAYPITDGAGGGEGRLQKARAYGAKAKTS